MRSGGLLLVSGIQLATFVAPLVLARTGDVDGEIAGLLSITGWFAIGMPCPTPWPTGWHERRRP